VFAHEIFFSDVQSSFRSDSASPVPCAPPEYLIAPYRAGDYEYIGVPLDHTQTDEESSGPSTAEIIANQSQDYIDEKLAEYQATIQQLQGELAMKRNEFVSIVCDGIRLVAPFLLEADKNCMLGHRTLFLVLLLYSRDFESTFKDEEKCINYSAELLALLRMCHEKA